MGPLADVEAAVAAGAEAAGRVGEVLVRHVIPRPQRDLEAIGVTPRTRDGESAP
jgi:microcompartment protein CcmL/EutN